jgi:pilus assembly protein Flp/PilA
MKRIAELLANDCGATAVEYAAVASLISIAAIGAVVTIGGKVATMFGGVSTAFLPRWRSQPVERSRRSAASRAAAPVSPALHDP